MYQASVDGSYCCPCRNGFRYNLRDKGDAQAALDEKFQGCHAPDFHRVEHQIPRFLHNHLQLPPVRTGCRCDKNSLAQHRSVRELHGNADIRVSGHKSFQNTRQTITRGWLGDPYSNMPRFTIFEQKLQSVQLYKSNKVIYNIYKDND